MSYFALLWKARTIEKCRLQYVKEKHKSIENNNMEVPANSIWDRWKRCRNNKKKKIIELLRTRCPKGSTAFNFFVYLRTDQTFPNFLLKSVIGFFGGILMTYLCFMFFIFQLSISLIHATIMSSVIGILLTLGLAFSYRVRCLVFLLIPQFFSRVGRYTLTCYALVLILTGPATNTLKNSEVLSESMACSQEQIKTSVNQIRDAMKKPLYLIKDSIKLMIDKVKEVEMKINKSFHNIEKLVLSIAAVLQSSSDWLDSIVANCNKKVGTPYNHCIKNMNEGLLKCKAKYGANSPYCNSDIVQSVCNSLKNKKAICHLVDFMGSSVVATIKKRLKTFFIRIKSMIHVDVHIQKSYTFSTNTSHSASQVAAGIVTEIRNRADPLLTWLSWSSCVTSLFLLLIIFRAKYYQNMYETRSRFDNRYITKELRELDLKRLRQGKETILPLNRRERTKYINTLSFRLIASERINLSRSIVFMVITTFKLLIHMVADYSLYWVLMTMRYYGRLQTPLQPGPPDAGIFVSGKGPVTYILRSLIESLTVPLRNLTPSSIPCLPNPYRPDLGRYSQIGVLIFLLWIFALFEPYGLRLRHVIMGHYRPERAAARATWLYNHILRTRGGFMKYARRKLHKQYKCSSGENFTFWYWVKLHLPCSWFRSLFGFGPVEPKCLLCGTRSSANDPDTELIKCETSKCPGTYCGKCFSDIGELCTICLSPADYGDLSDLSLEKGSSSESYDSDEDMKDFNKLSKAPQSGTSNQHDWQTYLYKHVYYKELNQTKFGKSDTNNLSKSNTQSQEESAKTENVVYESTEDENFNSICKSTSKLENYTIYLKKATLVRRKKRCYKQEIARNQLEQTQLGNKIAKYDDNSNCFHSDSETSTIKEDFKTNKESKTNNSTMSSNMFRRNKISKDQHFCCCRRRWIFSPPRKRVCCHKRKTLNLICKFRKRNVNKSIKRFKIKLHSHQRKFNKFMKSHKKCSKKIIKPISRMKYSLPVNFCSSALCSPHHLYDINKGKCYTVRKFHRSKKLKKILRSYKYQYKTNLSTVQDFLRCQEQKCRIPYYLQSKRFLKSDSLRYTVSDVDRLNILHNITVCSFNNKQTGKKTTKKNNKEQNTIKLNECCCEDIIKNKFKTESLKNCINKNLFSRCYFYWQNIRNKSRAALIAESKRKSKKLRNDNRNYKRRKKHKLDYIDLDANKYDKEDDENTRNYRLTSYLDSQEWYKPQNKNKENEDKLEKKTKGKNKAKHKKEEVEAKDQNMTSKIPDKTSEIILNVKSLNTGVAQNKPNNNTSIEVKKTKSDKTVSSSEKVLLIENYEYSIEAKVKEILKLESDEMCEQNGFLNVQIANTDTKPDEVMFSNKSGTSKKSNVKEEEEESLACSVKESKNMFTIMKTLYTSVLSFKNNKETQKDSDKKIRNTQTSDKDLQTEQTEQCKVDICVQTDNIQITDKEQSIRPTVSHSTCQYLVDDDWQRSITTQTTPEKPTKLSNKCDAQVETSIHKCTCATQYTSTTRDIGTIHRNSLLKLVNSGIQCTPILTNLAANSILHNKNDLNIIKEVSEKIMAKESSEDITSSITSDDSEKSEGAKTDNTVCSYVTMEYLDERMKDKNRRYKIVLITKANRSTATDKTEICNAGTVTDDWWSPMLERKDFGNTEIVKTGKPHSRRLKMKEAGATTEGRIVKFRSKTKIIPAGTKEILSPSRYLLESQKYYNELYTDLYQSPQKQKGDQVLLKRQNKYHNIDDDREISICNKDNENGTKLNLRNHMKNIGYRNQSMHPYELVQCQYNNLVSYGKCDISRKPNNKSISCQQTKRKESQNSGLKRVEPYIYLPKKSTSDLEIDPNFCVWDSSNNL